MTDVAVAAACQLPGCLFVDVDTLPDDAYGFIQLLFLMSCYGYALFTGANMIGDGAEEMLEFPAWEPIVGSIVLPVLGAVPDAAIVFFSGMGPDAQTQLSVGIGALAGSTVMLLTIPWVLSIYGGLVGYDTDEDEATHARVAAPMAGPDRDSIACNSMADGNSTEEQQDPDTILGVYALEPPADKMEAGKKYYAVAPYADKLWFSGKIMAASLISFVIIQWPAIQFSKNHKIVGVSNEPVWSLLAMVVTIFLFIANLYLQYKVTQEEDKTPSAYAQHLAEKKDNQAATEGLLKNYYSELRKLATDVVKLNSGKSDDDWREGNPGDGNYPEIIRSKGAFCGWDSSGGKKLWVEFKEAAGADEKLDEDELRLFLVDKAGVSAAETKNLAAVMNRYDKGDRLTQSGISYWEFLGLCIDLGAKYQSDENLVNPFPWLQSSGGLETARNPFLPDGWKPVEGTTINDCFKLMAMGTFLVLVFSDPMVDCLSALGTRTGIPVFYVSFLLAPLASNSSELVSSLAMAKQKTRSSITSALNQCLGACIMNNTLGLAVFLGLIYAKKLEWEYSSETICIMIPQLLVLPFTRLKVHNLEKGMMVAALYPFTLLLYIVLEIGLGWN